MLLNWGEVNAVHMKYMLKNLTNTAVDVAVIAVINFFQIFSKYFLLHSKAFQNLYHLAEKFTI